MFIPKSLEFIMKACESQNFHSYNHCIMNGPTQLYFGWSKLDSPAGKEVGNAVRDVKFLTRVAILVHSMSALLPRVRIGVNLSDALHWSI